MATTLLLDKIDFRFKAVMESSVINAMINLFRMAADFLVISFFFAILLIYYLFIYLIYYLIITIAICT